MIILSFLAGLLAAVLLFYCVNLRMIRAARKRRREEVKKNPEKKLQATKVIVFSVMVTYWIAFLVGVWVVIAKDVYQLQALLTFVGSVSVFAIAFYCWKSKAENLEKIKNRNPELTANLSDFSGMSSQ